MFWAMNICEIIDLAHSICRKYLPYNQIVCKSSFSKKKKKISQSDYCKLEKENLTLFS